MQAADIKNKIDSETELIKSFHFVSSFVKNLLIRIGSLSSC